MKKIVTILLLAFFLGGNFSWAMTYQECVTQQEAKPEYMRDPTACDDLFTPPGTAGGTCKTNSDCGAGFKCEFPNLVSIEGSCVADTQGAAGGACAGCSELGAAPLVCPSDKEMRTCDAKAYCCTPTTTSPGLPEDQNIVGMTIGPKCVSNGQCKFNIYDTLGIRTSVRNQGDPTSVGLFVQDIVLSATMFIGTIVTIAIIVSGLMRIFAGASGKDPTKAKSGLINSLIGLLLVVCSYLIIRLVQYIAKGV